MVLLQQMLIFLIMMIVGVIARKQGIITPSNQKQMSALVVNIANPALMITGALGDGEKLSVRELLLPFGLALIMFAVMIALAQLVPGLLRFPKDERCAVNLMLVFSNIGFIGMPLVSSLYGSEAMIYVTMFTLPFNILFYTYGIHVISAGGDGGKLDLKKMLNVGVIAGIITIILYLADITLPKVLTESVTMLSKLTGPMSMMIIGSSMLDIKFKEMFTDIPLLAFSLVKMVLLPVALLFVLKQFVQDEMLLGVCLVMLAAPAGSMIVMLTKQYNEKAYKTAAMGVSLTTVMSVLTMPLVSLITGIG
ncbi:MAG: AEC family transporter [Oscillospiraceae bacterium]